MRRRPATSWSIAFVVVAFGCGGAVATVPAPFSPPPVASVGAVHDRPTVATSVTSASLASATRDSAPARGEATSACHLPSATSPVAKIVSDPQASLPMQHRLGPAALPFAKYLVQVHARIHPRFSEQFIDKLAELPATHPLRDPKLTVKLDVALNPDGSLNRIGVVRTSGISAFDLGALAAFDCAAPFAPAPREIVSADGLVHFQWELDGGPVRCSTLGAYPYMT